MILPSGARSVELNSFRFSTSTSQSKSGKARKSYPKVCEPINSGVRIQPREREGERARERLARTSVIAARS